MDVKADAPDPSSILAEYLERDRLVSIGYPREPQDVPRLVAALEVALAHHQPQKTANDILVCPLCSSADGAMVKAPCHEVRGITRALLGEDASGD